MQKIAEHIRVRWTAGAALRRHPPPRTAAVAAVQPRTAGGPGCAAPAVVLCVQMVS